MISSRHCYSCCAGSCRVRDASITRGLHMMRSTIAFALVLMTAACASAPPAPPPPPPPAPPPPVRPTYEQKMSGLLRLEDQRMLRAPVAPATAETPGTPPPPDLTRLLTDEEARIRRRAALAVGRVGLADGVEPLLPVLGDADPEVRQMAAFALGLLG